MGKYIRDHVLLFSVAGALGIGFVFVCLFQISDVGGLFTAFIISLTIGLAYGIIRLKNNMEDEKEARARADLHKKKQITEEIQAAFVASRIRLDYASRVIKCIESNKTDQNNFEFLVNLVRVHEAKIYIDIFNACNQGEYDKAVLGLKILSEAANERDQYREALNLLSNSNRLRMVMMENGLNAIKADVILQER